MMGNGLPFCHFTFIFFNVSRFHVVLLQLLIVHRQMCIKGENGKCFAPSRLLLSESLLLSLPF